MQNKGLSKPGHISGGFGKPRYILFVLAAIVVAGALSLLQGAWAQNRNVKAAQQKESYTRPAPTKPLKPTIPEANRYQDDKVFLEYADSLFRPANEYEEYQIVKGLVKFRQGGMWMFCDSAYYYPEKNSMDAYGHVEMRQGDTLFVYADKLFYDGMSKHATLTHGPSRGNVELKNREVTLTTDSLDYDLNTELGWYSTGGRLQDDVNTLTSGYGEYSPSTKIAKFRDDVVLVNNKDGYRMLTEDLEYSTSSHIATISTPTRIEGENDTIITSRGWYNTQTDRAELTSRSTILHRDSSSNVTTLEGDSIVYDKVSRTSRAYMFRDPSRHRQPMVITDTARKVMLVGGYGEYNDSTQFAYSTDYPLLMEFSRPDTLFLRADTILSFIETVVEKRDSMTADSVKIELPGIAKEFHVARAIGCARFFNQDLQGIADTLLFKEQDSIMYMFRKPVVWTGERQVYGNRIDVHFNDSTPDWAELPEWGMVAEHIAEDFYDQMTGAHMKAFLENKGLKRLEVEGNVIAIMLPQENDSSYNKLVHAESSYLTLDMDSNKVKHLKMWPEVSGTVTPLFEVRNSMQFIEGFRWLEALRPVREWYGDRLRWADELGDVSEELEQYFNEPPLFKAIPKVAGRSLPMGSGLSGALPTALPVMDEKGGTPVSTGDNDVSEPQEEAVVTEEMTVETEKQEPQEEENQSEENTEENKE